MSFDPDPLVDIQHAPPVRRDARLRQRSGHFRQESRRATIGSNDIEPVPTLERRCCRPLPSDTRPESSESPGTSASGEPPATEIFRRCPLA